MLSRDESIRKAREMNRLYVCSTLSYDPDRAFFADVVIKDGMIIKNRYGFEDDSKNNR